MSCVKGTGCKWKVAIVNSGAFYIRNRNPSPIGNKDQGSTVKSCFIHF